MSEELVLVTGGSGFLGAHCILRLLSEGYRVRTTLRNMHREQEVRTMLVGAGAELGRRLSFRKADLLKDHWPEAVEGCDYVMHVASPFPANPPSNENQLIKPAREGALRVLKAARRANVKRVVMTSSFAAIGYGQAARAEPFTEADWTDVEGDDVRAYVKSKTLAERAAWDFMQREGAPMELAVVNPVGILGPVLGADISASILIVKRLLDGAMPGCPRFSFGLVDVRDVADLHLRAMVNPAAAGQRFLAIADRFMSVKDIGGVLRERLGAAARKVPKGEMPNWLVRAVAMLDSAVAQIVPELDKVKQASNEKAKSMLGWSPRSSEEAIVACAESLLKLGLVKGAAKAA